MSWSIIDADGDGGDFATNMGIGQLRRDGMTPLSVIKFLDDGVADAALAKQIIADCRKAKLGYISDLFEGLTPPITLTDGVE